MGKSYLQALFFYATMEHDHIDRPPLGDLAGTFASLMLSTVENNITLEQGRTETEGRGSSLFRCSQCRFPGIETV